MWRLSLSLLSLVNQISAVTIPPSIFIQAPFDVYYKAGETVKIECVADGIPHPVYTWKRNGIDFNPQGYDDRVVQLPDVGTIVFIRPEDRDEGIFQCFATNNYGVSASIKVNLREAKLKDFQIGPDTTVSPRLGQPLTLNCVPPESIPPPQVFWIAKKTGGGFDALNLDARVTMDHEHRLRITNVKASDYMDGRAYACMAINEMMRKPTQGPQFFIRPQGTTEELSPVTYMWASPEDHFGLRGNQFKVKCIFSGNPTPDVHWVRTDGAPLPDRAKILAFGMEMVIDNLQFEDAGTYECWASNSNTQTRVQRTVSVRVESVPYWLLEPQDVEIGVGGTAQFDCLAKAVPTPEYWWFINGVPLQNVKDSRITPDRFKRPRPDRIVFENVNREDAMVIQCNATNKHGYIWGDVYLNVLSEAPTILTPPDPEKLVAEGTSVNLTCRVAGKPDPIITWYKDNQQISGGRYKIMPSGELYIKQVVLSDAGLYTCEARNIFNVTSSSGKLLVRRKTLIEQKPLDLEVNAGTDAKFTCSGTTDPEEVDKLQIKWLKDNKEISAVVQRMTTNKQDNSLTISGTIVRDSGSYTCVATNGLDQEEASAMLTVRDRPDSPSEVKVEKCATQNATVSWIPGSYNNAPVQYYVIQYNTSFSPDTWNFGVRVDSMYSIANVSLTPWVNYTFRVIAYNKIGESDPSFPNPIICKTNAERPRIHPQNLRTIGDRPGFLHIEWTPMPEIQQNGPGFQYILQYEREGYPTGVQQFPIDDWRVREKYFAVGNQIYEPYIITLKAKNSVGDAMQDPPKIRGFTAESIPNTVPETFQAEQVEDTYAVLTWEFDYQQINKTPTAINGEFRGFKIQFWQRGYKDDTLREWNILPKEALASRNGRQFEQLSKIFYQ
ncbi:neuroglian-like isoform X2 [Pomacea canaliculata]|uniref:neuroglian-like isoform X2 n=1 Tax=Pomacea canaliculata TaxID=400727 RepID=UPI000D7315E6|nr:neuroglian-like isoform X2 [Pomacea canaliculata]XP_025108154.1 neuroglian-like isoform X2 [Pomacea canaliculata]